MVDVIYIATLIAFFGLMVAFVHWCEHIIGKDDAVSLPFDGIDEDEDADGRVARPHGPEGGGAGMKNYDNLVGLILSVLVTGLPDLRPHRPREALMSQNVIEVIILIVLLAISTPLLGNYMAKVFQNKKAPGDRVFLPGRAAGIYRVTGVNPEGEQRWTVYAISLLAFSLVSVLVLYGMQRLQAHLPFNPDHLATVPPRCRSTRRSASSPTPTGRTTPARTPCPSSPRWPDWWWRCSPRPPPASPWPWPSSAA